MAKGFAKIFYNSARWKRCRDSYIQQRRIIDGGMCEECHDRFGDMEPGVQDGWLNEKIMRKQRATKKKIMSLIIRKKCKDREGDKKT